MASIDLVVRTLEGSGAQPDCIVPFIDDRDLAELVSEFEETHGYQPAGGYDGIVPANYRFGPLLPYYLGGSDRGREIFLLGCSCGELGCWPLDGRVDVRRDTVVWSAFRQPHRPDRTYDGFGPFTFDRRQYEAAAANVAAVFDRPAR